MMYNKNGMPRKGSVTETDSFDCSFFVVSNGSGRGVLKGVLKLANVVT